MKKLTPAVVKDKIILIRMDLNVSIDVNGDIKEKTRIKSSIPTLEFCLKHGAKRIHVLSHLGRPKGLRNPKLSLKPVAHVMATLSGHDIEFRPDFSVGTKRIQLHENVRFYEGELKNDPAFIQEILKLLEPKIFINDGFSVSHRKHASLIGVGSFLPSYPGLLVEKEIHALSPYLPKKKMPGLTIVVGGAKIETKAPILNHFAKTAENIIVGGALANTFLAAQGFDMGESLYEPEFMETAQEILEVAEKHKTGFHCPLDLVCADDPEAQNVINITPENIEGSMKAFDIGQKTIASFTEVLNHSKTIIWNGPLGLFEKKPFENGTREIIKAIATKKSSKTVLGGGDTLSALKKFGVEQNAFSHVSTGGGAMLVFLEGEPLPGIEILK